MSRRWPILVALLLALLTAACKDAGAVAGPGSPATPRGGLPSSMAALGDSITAGFGSCLALSACTRNSWSAGGGTAVDSHYQRIRKANTAMRGNAHNFAVRGARVSALSGQATAAVRAKVAYVTVLIGANDVCRTRAADMTSVTAFRAELDQALAVLAKGLPQARILVVSIPDLYRLWQVGHTNRVAVRVWSLGVCPALLANPASVAAADTSRRKAFQQRVDAYNRQLSAACRAYGRHCRYDGGAAHRVRFTLDMVNHLDYFHPDTDGQNKLAEVTFPRRFNW